jgi:uncharacterized protein YbjQ (UPF0145 family)
LRRWLGTLPSMIRRAYPTDLSDVEWACLEPYLPNHTGTGRPRLHSLREVLGKTPRSPRRHTLAVFEFVNQHRYVSWRELFEAWNEEHPHQRFKDRSHLYTAYTRAVEKSLMIGILVRYVVGTIAARPGARGRTEREVQGSMFSGLMPAMVTPFDERGEVDLAATEAVVERFIEAGVNGISPLGSTGESAHLTGDERKRFAEEVVRIVGGRVPLLIGVGASGTREAVELSRHAQSVGADAVLIVSPFYWKVGEEALFRHFAAVAESVEIPLVVYNLPMLTA